MRAGGYGPEGVEFSVFGDQVLAREHLLSSAFTLLSWTTLTRRVWKLQPARHCQLPRRTRALSSGAQEEELEDGPDGTRPQRTVTPGCMMALLHATSSACKP